MSDEILAREQEELPPAADDPSGPSRPPWMRAVPFLVLAAVVGGLAFGAGRLTGGGGEAAGHDHGAEDEGTTWTCSMHPQIQESQPGQCPICGMDLIPLVTGDDNDLAPNEVSLSERARVLARVRTTEVRRLAASGETLRMLGRVDYDENTLQTVTAWAAGRIDRLHVRVTGERIRRGQVVASLFSPEVYAAQQDLITAKAQITRLAGASPIARSSAEAMLNAARQRLLLLGVPQAQVGRMERASSPARNVAIRSPFAGTVLERLASEGAYVQTGTPLYRVANLTRLWVQLDAYESDLPHLSVGQTVQLEVEALPGQPLDGRIAFVDPVIDPRRRTARVRIEVSSPERRLRPGMFVEAVVRAGDEGGEGRQPLIIPASAALFTGRRSVVYVQLEDRDRPTYEARVVRLAPRVGDVFPVVAGLVEGERVVTNGAFALDADLQIRGGQSMMMGGDDAAPGPYDLAIETPAEWDAALRPVVAAYLEIQQHLADDEFEGAKTSAGALLTAVDAVTVAQPDEAVEAWRPLAQHLRMHATRLAAADSIEQARGQFEVLGERIALLLRTFGNPMDTTLRVAFCPMAFDNRGAEWVQSAEEVENSYFGHAMRTCGSVRDSVEPNAFLPAESAE